MKIRFLKDYGCDFYDHRMDETYPKYFRKWDELIVESLGNMASLYDLHLPDGDIVLGVPIEAVERIPTTSKSSIF